MHKYPRGRYQQDGARLFLVVPGNRTGGNGFKLKYGKFHLHVGKNCFPVMLTEHWNSMPREVAESLSLQMFESCLDVILDNVL